MSTAHQTTPAEGQDIAHDTPAPADCVHPACSGRAAHGWQFRLERVKCRDGISRFVGRVANRKTREQFSAGCYDSKTEATATVLTWLANNHGVELCPNDKRSGPAAQDNR